MKLKKLTPELAAGIVDAGFDKEPRAIQSASIPKIKSGADLIIVAPEGSGKSSTLAMGVIQKLKEAKDHEPRAIVLTSTKEKAFELEEQLKVLGKHTNLRTFTAFDQGILEYQRNTIYEGVDVLIGTPKRLNELMNTAGFPLSLIILLMVDDAEALYYVRQNFVINRMAESIPKAQIVVFANKWIDKFDDLTEEVMKGPQIIEVE